MPFVQRKPPQQYTKQRDTFYDSPVWRSERKEQLTHHPLCFYCQLKGIVTAANTNDHFKPKRIYPELSLDRNNYRSSCKPCHDSKRQWESTIATREQFEANIESFIKSISR